MHLRPPPPDPEFSDYADADVDEVVNMHETDITGLVRTCTLFASSPGHIEEFSTEYVEGFYLNNNTTQVYLSITRAEHYLAKGWNGGTYTKEDVATGVVHNSSPQIQCYATSGPYFTESACYFEVWVATP